jgi:hypothetical protein
MDAKSEVNRIKSQKSGQERWQNVTLEILQVL